MTSSPRPVLRPPPATAAARRPAQTRSQERVEAALAAAESLLVSAGPESISIPAIATAAGVPRASLYPFFADKYALLGCLAERHLAAVADQVEMVCRRHAESSIERYSRALVDAAADYYAQHPAAAIVVLGGPWSPAAYHAQQAALARIAAAVREALAARAPGIVLARSPDVICLMVEMGFACLKHGYFSEGRISPALRREAVRAQLAYLAALVEAAEPAP